MTNPCCRLTRGITCVQTYGVFYATSFLDLYRSPRQLSAASLSLTVVVDSDEQYLFLVSRRPLLFGISFPKTPFLKKLQPQCFRRRCSGVCVQVRAIAPFLGPPSDLSVVKMIPNERLPPRNLHRVRAEKTQAVLKWQPPYDSPSEPLVGRLDTIQVPPPPPAPPNLSLSLSLS